MQKLNGFLIRSTAFFYFMLYLAQTTRAQLQKPYEKPIHWAVTSEIGGTSPIFSLNAEYVPIRLAKSFFVIRGGIGYLFRSYTLCTLPHSLTWNVVLKRKRRVCSYTTPQNNLFAEIGVSGVHLVGDIEGMSYRMSPVVGARRYFTFNSRATGFLKVQFTPIVSGKLSLWGGLGVGLIVD